MNLSYSIRIKPIMMKSKLLTLLIIVTLNGYGQDFDWSFGIASGGSAENIGRSIVMDATGNIYTAGSFTGTADFDPSSGVLNLTAQGSLQDIFIHKIDPNGNLVWAKSIGGSAGQDVGYSIQLDASGNVCVVGEFIGTVDFDPGPGIFNLSSAGNNDSYLLKLTENGDFIFAKRWGSTSIDIARNLTIDLNDNLIITGSYAGTVDFDPNAGTNNVTSAASISGYILKLNSNGNFVWVYSIEGGATTQGYSLTSNNTNEIFAIGYYDITGGSADFEPGSGVTNLTSIGSSDIYILKLTSTGNFQNVVGISGTSSDFPGKITIDNNGLLYITGQFIGTTDLDPTSGVQSITSAGSNDFFVIQMDQSFNFNWGKTIGNSNDSRVIGLTADDQNNVYITGSFAGTLDFDPGPSVFNLTWTFGHGNSFLWKLDSNGDFVYALNTGNSVGFNFAHAVCISDLNEVYITGQYSDITDADPSANNFFLNSSSDIDLGYFVSKFNQCQPTSSTIAHTDCDSYVWPTNGTTYNTSGTYTHILTNSAGCDSIVTLNLTINNSTSSVDAVTACDSYVWPVNGVSYNAGGFYSHVITNAAGCDSTITLSLTIKNSTSGSANVTTCDSYTWSANATNYTTSGIYNATLTNVAGCDSIATLNLTINNNYSTTENITICNSDAYTLPNGTVVDTDGSYNSFLSSVNGCDSTIITNLTVINPNIGITSNATTLTSNAFSVTYQWIHCNNGNDPISGATSSSFTPTFDGTFGVIITENGCVDTSACILINVDISGLNEIEHESVIVYPNPADDVLYFHLDKSLIIPLEYKLVDLSGKKILSGIISASDSSKAKLDITLLPAGNYLILFKSYEFIKPIKIVKQ